MGNVIQFVGKYRVLFNLPADKVIKMRKTAKDDFDIEISNGYGIAYVNAAGKNNAETRIKKVFPNAEIVETNPL